MTGTILIWIWFIFWQYLEKLAGSFLGAPVSMLSGCGLDANGFEMDIISPAPRCSRVGLVMFIGSVIGGLIQGIIQIIITLDGKLHFC